MALDGMTTFFSLRTLTPRASLWLFLLLSPLSHSDHWHANRTTLSGVRFANKNLVQPSKAILHIRPR